MTTMAFGLGKPNPGQKLHQVLILTCGLCLSLPGDNKTVMVHREFRKHTLFVPLMSHSAAQSLRYFKG